MLQAKGLLGPDGYRMGNVSTVGQLCDGAAEVDGDNVDTIVAHFQPQKFCVRLVTQFISPAKETGSNTSSGVNLGQASSGSGRIF